MPSRVELEAILARSPLFAAEKAVSCLVPDAIRDVVLGAVPTDAFLACYAAEIDRAAAALRGRPVPALPFRSYRMFDDSGDRGRFEAPYFERRRGLVAAALASWLWRRPEDLAVLEDQIWAVCDEYSWALPAHLEGTSLDPGRISPETAGTPGAAHPELLDLFSCETAFALAEITAILGPSLTPIVAARARMEVERRVLAPFPEKADPWRWELMRNNWCAVCAGSVGAAALYLVRDARALARILDRVLPTLGFFLDSFAGDGTCLEGVGYWTYGIGFFSSFAELLDRATGGAVDLASDPRFGSAAGFQRHCYLNGSLALSFSDGSPDERWRTGLAAFLNRKFPAARPPDANLAAGFGRDDCGRWCLSFRDLWWPLAASGSPQSGTAASAASAWLPDAQWLVCPEREPGALAFAAKGGSNDEPHNHNDVGSFELVLGDAQLLADLGCGEYTRDYFGEGRYSIFCNSSFGHSLPMIDGQGQLPGPERRARDVRFKREAGGFFLSMDIAAAYGGSALAALARSFEFDGSTRLVVRDEYALARPGVALIERFVSRAPAEAFSPSGEEGGFAIRAGSRFLLVSCSEACPSAVLSGVEHREHDGRTSIVTCLDYSFSPHAGRFRVEFEFRLAARRE